MKLIVYPQSATRLLFNLEEDPLEMKIWLKNRLRNYPYSPGEDACLGARILGDPF